MTDKELAGGQSSSYFLLSQNYINKGENYHLPTHNDFFWGKRNLMIVLGTNLARIYNFSPCSILAVCKQLQPLSYILNILPSLGGNLVLGLSPGPVTLASNQ